MKQFIFFHLPQLRVMIFVIIVHKVNATSNYMYHIDTTNRVIEGFVYEDFETLSKIHVSPEALGDQLGTESGKKYLQITVKDTSSNRVLENIKNRTEFQIDQTDSIFIDRDNYLVINKSNVFENSTEFQFFVVLVDKWSGEILSNPLPFIIRQVKKGNEVVETYSHDAAIFAGVLILVIVFLAFLIPCVVRAKRRMRAGKPVMKLGSHSESDEALDKRNSNDTLDFSHRTSSVPNWYGESAVNNYAGEIEKEKRHFTKDIKHLEHELEQQGRPTFSIGSEDGQISSSEQPTKSILKNSHSEQAVSRL